MFLVSDPQNYNPSSGTNILIVVLQRVTWCHIVFPPFYNSTSLFYWFYSKISGDWEFHFQSKVIGFQYRLGLVFRGGLFNFRWFLFGGLVGFEKKGEKRKRKIYQSSYWFYSTNCTLKYVGICSYFHLESKIYSPASGIVLAFYLEIIICLRMIIGLGFCWALSDFIGVYWAISYFASLAKNGCNFCQDRYVLSFWKKKPKPKKPNKQTKPNKLTNKKTQILTAFEGEKRW